MSAPGTQKSDTPCSLFKGRRCRSKDRRWHFEGQRCRSSPTVAPQRAGVTASRASDAAFFAIVAAQRADDAASRAIDAAFFAIVSPQRANAATSRAIDGAFFAIPAPQRAGVATSRAIDAAFFAIVAAQRGSVAARQNSVAIPGSTPPARAAVAANENGPGCVGSRGRVGWERSRRPGAAGVGGQLWVVVVSPFVRDLAKRLDSSLRRPSRPWLRPDSFSRA